MVLVPAGRRCVATGERQCSAATTGGYFGRAATGGPQLINDVGSQMGYDAGTGSREFMRTWRAQFLPTGPSRS